MSRLSSTVLGAGLVLACLAMTSSAMVIGIDFGSKFMKVALVKPGAPFQIVTNVHSKRKTETMVGFYEGERLYGYDAKGLSTRKPHRVFQHSRELLGRSADHPIAAEVMKSVPFEVYSDESRGTLRMKLGAGTDDEKDYSAEEVVAMVLQHAQDIAQEIAGGRLRDCVITVPSFFTQFERQALVDAANVAGMKVLSLIEENTAAALQFGIDRKYENTTHTVLFYNMGARSTQVTVARYSAFTVKSGRKNKTVGDVTVLGKAWDATLGGDYFDARLAAHFAKAFAAKNPKLGDVSTIPRPAAKLAAAATKVKEILSANEEFPASVESLHKDVDFRQLIKRSEFEEMNADLFKRALLPVTKALESAGLTVADLDGVEMLGGGMRIPKLQADLTQLLAPVELGMHLNSDEAMALGAAFRAANISTAFRVRVVGLTDVTAFPVGVRLVDRTVAKKAAAEEGSEAADADAEGAEDADADAAAAAEEPAANAFSKRATLFKKFNRVGSRKQVSLAHGQDLDLTFSYGEGAELPAGTPTPITRYLVKGIKKAANGKLAKRLNATEPKVSLSFVLTPGGLVDLAKAEASFVEIIYPKNATPAAPAPAPVEEDANATATTEGEGEKAAEGERKLKEEGESKAEAEKPAAAEGEGEAKADAGDDKKAEEGKEEAEEEDPKAKAKADAAKAKAEADAAKAAKKAAKARKPRKKTHRVPLKIVLADAPLSIRRLGKAAKSDSVAVLAALTAADAERKANQAAKNTLESYVYAARAKLAEHSEILEPVTTEEQVEELRAALEAAEDWLYEEGDATTVEVYQEKQKSLSTPLDAMMFRAREATARPKAVEALRSVLALTTTKMAAWAVERPQVTEEEKAELTALLDTTSEWADEKEKAQAETAAHDTPAFTSRAVRRQAEPVLELVKKLLRKPKPLPPVVIDTNATDANATDANATDANATATDAAEGASSSDDAAKEEAAAAGEEAAAPEQPAKDEL